LYPDIQLFGSLSLPSWHIAFVLAACAAFWMFRGLNDQLRFATDLQTRVMFVSAYVSAYVGARIFAIVVEQQLVGVQALGELFRFGPMTFYGGFIGIVVSSFGIFFLYKGSQAIDRLSCADAACVAGFFALGIGRIGCFLNGDDYGLMLQEPAPWWAVTFLNHEELVPRIPTQLLESSIAFLLAILGYLFTTRRYFPKGVACLSSLACYGLYRFFAEYLRGDFRGHFISDALTPAQWISIGVIVVCNIGLYQTYIRHKNS
jgi:phosphatidylglycerol:prolipoprotein diacylglycerol transferase